MERHPSLLIVVLDIHPLAWSRGETGSQQDGTSADKYSLESSLSHVDSVLDQLIVFFSSHLAIRCGNELVLYVAMAQGKSEMLYSSQGSTTSTQDELAPDSFEPFNTMAQEIRSRLRSLMIEQLNALESSDSQAVNDPKKASWTLQDGPAIVPALLKTLCHVNQMNPASNQGEIQNLKSSVTGHFLDDEVASARARIMIINNSRDKGRGGYVGLMNAVFAAQKRRTPIDVINLHQEDSIFLQQAAHLTNGIYFRSPHYKSLLHYLNLVFLAPVDVRQELGLPSQDKVDFRAICFCHHRVIDVGFVCSVCLSIFCEPKPICGTCQSRFPMQSVLQLKKSIYGSEKETLAGP